VKRKWHSLCSLLCHVSEFSAKSGNKTAMIRHSDAEYYHHFTISAVQLGETTNVDPRQSLSTVKCFFIPSPSMYLLPPDSSRQIWTVLIVWRIRWNIITVDLNPHHSLQSVGPTHRPHFSSTSVLGCCRHLQLQLIWHKSPTVIRKLE